MSGGRPKATEHGTYAYARANSCKCPPCDKARKRYEKGYRIDHARGIKRRIPAEPAREHIAGLLEDGATPHQIQKAAKIAEAVYRNLMDGRNGRPPAKTLERATSARIVRLDIEDVLAETTMLPAIGVARRLHALMRLGHGTQALADEMSVSVTCVYVYMDSERCMTRTVDAVHAAYLRLRDYEGTSGHARWKAIREQWAPPMAWDDDTIDDPDAEPAGITCVLDKCSKQAVTRSLCPTHDRAVGEVTEARYFKQRVDRLNRRPQKRDAARLRGELSDLKRVGYTEQEAVQRLGASPSYVEKIWGQVA